MPIMHTTTEHRTAHMDDWLAEPQPRLGATGLLVLLVLGSLTAPLSLDMYTPSIPTMTAYFHTTDDIVNLTLVGYYLFMAVGLLAFGPLSDKFGRRPVLMAGTVAYCAASVACAMAPTIWVLVGARVVQALGSGAMNAVCTAMVKDAIKPAYRERMLAVVQIVFVVGPAGAPIIGASILSFTDWRGVFVALALVSGLQLVLVWALRETLPVSDRLTTSVPATLARLIQVAKNPVFMAFLLITSAWEIAYMGYVSVGSYIYIDFFGFSAFAFSLFFTAAALMGAVGPAAWIKLSAFVSRRNFTTVALVCSLAVGIGVLVVGKLSAFVFCGFFLIFVFFESAVRPYAVNALLAQQEADTGSAAALINCVRALVGVAGMFLVVAPVFPDYVDATGWMMTGGLGLALAGWAVYLHCRRT